MLEQNRPPALMSGENDENARSQILIGVGFVFCLLFDVSSPHQSSPDDLPSSPEHLRPGNVVAVGSSTAQQQRICCKAPWESVTAMRANMHKISAKMGKIVT